MKIIDQSWAWEQKPKLPLETLEKIGRVCYKSEDKISPQSAQTFVKALLNSGHESVIEHVSASVRFITNRGVTHELVRHRLCAFSQESTRYVRYSGDLEFIKPVWCSNNLLGYYAQSVHAKSRNKRGLSELEMDFQRACMTSEYTYLGFLHKGWRPEQAREVLPHALKTEIIVTANLREWRHIFRLRTSKKAHPQMKALMLDCLAGFQKEIPVLFNF